MEKNSDSQVPPEFCTNNCGFYGNPIYENMCSKCFKAKEEQANKKSLDNSPPQTTNDETALGILNTPTTESSFLESLQPQIKHQPQPIESIPSLLAPSAQPTPPHSPSPTKKLQNNKGRCLVCKSRIPLVKQTTNKCRCEKVFCDVHKFPDQHNCEFDFLQRDRKELEKKNPKINEQPRGGRSFTRID